MEFPEYFFNSISLLRKIFFNFLYNQNDIKNNSGISINLTFLC